MGTTSIASIAFLYCRPLPSRSSKSFFVVLERCKLDTDYSRLNSFEHVSCRKELLDQTKEHAHNCISDSPSTRFSSDLKHTNYSMPSTHMTQSPRHESRRSPALCCATTRTVFCGTGTASPRSPLWRTARCCSTIGWRRSSDPSRLESSAPHV